MVVKKKWTELISENNLSNVIGTESIQLATTLDSLMNTKFGMTTKVSQFLSSIKTDYLTASEDNVWSEMPIYLSSYKERDKRVVLTLNDRLNKYLRFYTKMVDEDGLARQMSIDRGFNNVSADSDTTKDYYSETPSEELDNFETAIVKYASNLSKNERARRGNQNGTSYERAKNTTWEEGMKNLRLVFYNDLMEFIASLPNVIYNYYCLDSRPYPALVKEYYKSLFNSYKIEYER